MHDFIQYLIQSDPKNFVLLALLIPNFTAFVIKFALNTMWTDMVFMPSKFKNNPSTIYGQIQQNV